MFTLKHGHDVFFPQLEKDIATIATNYKETTRKFWNHKRNVGYNRGKPQHPIFSTDAIRHPTGTGM